MSYLLAIDQGTSSTRARLYTITGQLVASSQYPITQYYPQPGWVEHDPEEIWQKTLRALQEVVAQVDSQAILCCGITNQRETTVLWDKKTGHCVAPAIVWQDRRTANWCASLKEHKTLIQQKTGLLPDPYFSASKIHWLLQHNEQAQQLVAQQRLAFGTIDSFLMWRLTQGAHVTDVTNASRTMLFNLKQQQWDNDLLELFAIPPSILPEIAASDASFGIMAKEWLGVAIPITGVAGDQQAALIGQGCFHEGMIKATFGTGAFLLMTTGEQPVVSSHQLLSTVAYKIKGKTMYGLEGSIYHAGTTIKWLRDEMKLITTAGETEELAYSLSSNDNVYMVPSFTGLGAPHWSNHAGAMLTGLSLKTNKAHFARAALEAVCYQTREVLTCMRHDSAIALTELRVDGGMAANQWLLQFLADQCQLQVHRPQDIETTVKGAAILAGIGHDVYHSLSELKAVVGIDKQWLPNREIAEVERDYNGWQRALACKLGCEQLN